MIVLKWVSVLSERGDHVHVVDDKGVQHSVNVRTGTCRNMVSGECSVLPKEDVDAITDLLFGP